MIITIPLAKQCCKPYTKSVNLQERIRTALRKHGMTQADFADRCGVTQAHMSTIINLGRDVRLSTYEKIDAALKVLEGTQGAGRS